MNIVVIGAGRMGKALTAEIEGAEDLSLTAILERVEEAVLPPADVCIDFSHPANLPAVCEAAARQRIPLVLGTTGLEPRHQQRVEEAALRTPVVQAANFSTGVTILQRLLREMRQVRSLFDVEIVEAHHRWKVDAPSGTAKALARALCDTPEEAAALPTHAIRGGTVAGEHAVLFLGEDETLELRHSAGGRQIFARGALLAARFVRDKAPGLYTMENVLWDR